METGYDAPLAVSAFKDGTKKAYDTVVLDPTVGQLNTHTVTSASTISTALVANVAHLIPQKTFQISVGGDDIILTQNSEINMQMDLAITSTVGLESNPAT